MSGYLRRLVARTLGHANVVRPRLRPHFLVNADADDAEAAIGTLWAARNSGTSEDGRVVADGDAAIAGHRDGQRGDSGIVYSESGSAGARSDSAGSSEFSNPLATVDSAGRASGGVLSRSQAGGFAKDDRAGQIASETVTTAILGGGERAGVHLEPDRGALPDETERRISANRLTDTQAHDRTEPHALTESLALLEAPIAPVLAGTRAARSPMDIVSRAVNDSARDERNSAEETTIVNVSIGRIEVRSTADPPIRAYRDATSSEPKPRDQLDAYLRGRTASRR